MEGTREVRECRWQIGCAEGGVCGRGGYAEGGVCGRGGYAG
jgi:hypothetical protein